jgi:hypothetical protein
MVENEREGVDARAGFGWGAVAKEKKNRWRGERREKTLFMLIIMDENAIVLALRSIIAIQMFSQN